MFRILTTYEYLFNYRSLNSMGVSEEIFDSVMIYLDKNKGADLKQISLHLNLKEEELKPIIDLLLAYNFINNSNGYKITKMGREYLKVKS